MVNGDMGAKFSRNSPRFSPFMEMKRLTHKCFRRTMQRMIPAARRKEPTAKITGIITAIDEKEVLDEDIFDVPAFEVLTID